MNQYNDMKQTHNPNNTNEGGPFTNWGAQKECVAPKSLSKHYFE
jgi:hypothetical protein